MIENKTQQFSRFYLNANKSKFNEIKESGFIVGEIKNSSKTRK